jgi:regulation of enolase protein 1 (concanavalin A-like superfamily)
VILRWLGRPGVDGWEADGTIGFGAGPLTDWFHDPRTGTVTTAAPVALVATGATPVTVGCHVVAELRATFDAAGLFVHYGDEHWVKLALERSPAGEPTIVTVRTATASDDCNHWPLAGSDCWFRASVDERSVAFHVSDDASTWRLVRYCAPPLAVAPTVGLLVQSPTGDGTTGTFDTLVVESRRVEELRDGS